ncbi:MAG: class I SAM-dependent methyltransferase [Candidatus Kariarchaeaceae archaeon]|jgi:SAM-dependent methyltransferase
MDTQLLNSEFVELNKIGILAKTDSISDIVHGTYLYENWAEHFWRRRKSHARRPDPEVTFVEKANPRTVLEVGCAYGRFTRKILELNGKRSQQDQIAVTGIEINPQFEQFQKLYSEEHSILQNGTFLFDNILNCDKLFPKHSFDVVVIPMHTFPNFGIDFIKQLLPKLRYLLSPDGQCIFSTNKTLRNINNPESLSQDDYSGSFDLEKGKPPKASIVYTFPAQKKDFGYRRIYYIIYYSFNTVMDTTERIITRSIDDIILPDKLEKLIKEFNFNINYIEEEQFSMVYGISIRE